MCVSLLAVAIEKTHIHFLHRKQLRKSVQVLQRPLTILPANKGVKKRKSKVSTSDSLIAEPVFLENSETTSELLSTSVDIHRIHGQLRRLKNDSSILKEAVITAIPNQHSKVLFKFAKLPNIGLPLDMKVEGSGSSSSSRDNVELEPETEPVPATSGKCPDEKLGFIMFECGLEGISLKGVKNSEALLPNQAKGREDELSREKEDSVSVTICNEVRGTCSSSNLSSGAPPAPSTSVSETCEGDQDEDEATLSSQPLLKSEPVSIGVVVVDVTEIGAGDPPQPEGGTPVGHSKAVEKVGGAGAASVSCVIEFKVMWYNFAAPPQTPITRKIDYTR